ncbi:hypothetical protein CEXT_52961 [Caerostris extrusa]|uniref:C2H2-type domain-containing protein n=1 Tax=Caerostris extrusa TaxID=172846 RepID=A0AAV4NXR0_CAEEX|nr:hypothetical protein CEXT_52961 [Caerostris extrusa]
MQGSNRPRLGDESWKPYCCICNRQFSRPKSLRRHQQVVHALFPKVFHCKWCPRSYNRKDNLKQHVNLCHVDMLMANAQERWPSSKCGRFLEKIHKLPSADKSSVCCAIATCHGKCVSYLSEDLLHQAQHEETLADA